MQTTINDLNKFIIEEVLNEINNGSYIISYYDYIDDEYETFDMYDDDSSEKLVPQHIFYWKDDKIAHYYASVECQDYDFYYFRDSKDNLISIGADWFSKDRFKAFIGFVFDNKKEISHKDSKSNMDKKRLDFIKSVENQLVDSHPEILLKKL